MNLEWTQNFECLDIKSEINKFKEITDINIEEK